MPNTEDLETLLECGGMVTLPRLTFKVDRPVVVESGTVIDGNGAVIIPGRHDRHTLLVRNCRNVGIRNLRIWGDWTSSSSGAASIGAAIRIEQSSNVLIENVTISTMMGRGIVATSNVEDLTIRGCRINDCAISIFLFKDVRSSMIESNRISNSRLIGIYVDDAAEGDTEKTAEPNHLTIVRGNIIEGGGTSPRNTGFGIAVSGSTDTIITSNIVRSFGNAARIGHGIVLNNGQGEFSQGMRTVVIGNILSDHTGYGLYSVGQERLVEFGNVYSGNGSGDFKLIGVDGDERIATEGDAVD
jgi:Right handed beta helix region